MHISRARQGNERRHCRQVDGRTTQQATFDHCAAILLNFAADDADVTRHNGLATQLDIAACRRDRAVDRAVDLDIAAEGSNVARHQPAFVDFNIAVVDDQIAADGAAAPPLTSPLIDHDIAVDSLTVAHGQIVVENLLLRNYRLDGRSSGAA